jgi:hypothetical protein
MQRLLEAKFRTNFQQKFIRLEIRLTFVDEKNDKFKKAFKLS